MPIERLLPGGLPPLPPPAAPPETPKVRFRTLKRLAGHVLLATLTVVAVAIWKLPLRQYVRARSLPPSAAATAAKVAHLGQRTGRETPVARKVDARTEHDPREPAKSTAARALGAKAGAASLQRHAVELVIAGDFAAAEQAYRALASEQPDAHAYHEAARILTARRGK